MDKKKPILYFLCTGNSCRSQMAEGWARHLAGDRFEVYSGGIESHGVNPIAITIMGEIGIDITDQTSDLIDLELLNRSDYVITLCGDANDKCPTTPPHVQRDHWGFIDPAKATGSEEEVLQVFRQVRDEIGKRIKTFIDNYPFE